jgi:hypothetical protein
MKSRRFVATAAGLVLAQGALAMCYEVYSGKDRLVYRSTQPPVDLSQPLHETVPTRFGAGSTMMFFQAEGSCPSEDTRKSAPVLTEEDVGKAFGRSRGPARNLDRYFTDREIGDAPPKPQTKPVRVQR